MIAQAIVGGAVGRLRRGHVEQLPAQGELGGSLAVCKEAIVADAVKAIGQAVQQEAADELVRCQEHGLGLAMVAVILPAEPDLLAIEVSEPAIGDGHAVGVAAEIGQNLLRPAKGGFE